ncbi:MAG: hypothetical protein UF228_11330 [Lachnospiraceae bacterium]|nr:hypothetical protein [Lachnospiraceae bacterium]
MEVDEKNIKFVGIKLKIKLEAQMPMIHFQSRHIGATLRASEVKPKLDRFIIDSLQRKDKLIDCEVVKKQHRDIFNNPETNDALDYKMQVIDEKPEQIDLEEYKIFYGNMGLNDDEKKYGILSNPEITIICFNKKLQALIEQNIEKFFILTNFGTMQNKGFGSFVPTEWLKRHNNVGKIHNEVGKYFKESIENSKCFVQVLPLEKGMEGISKFIKDFYSVMKSGYNDGKGKYARSYIYQYMHNEHNIHNEKAWMKKNQIAPACVSSKRKLPLVIENNRKDKDIEHYYVRAFLGIGNAVEFGTDYNEKGFISKPVRIEIKSEELDRVSSPILFKVINNFVYIAAKPVPSELYGKKFEFVNVKSKENGELSVPKKEFDVQDFLEKYIEYFNGELKEKVKVKDFKNYNEIKEVKINE